MRPGGSVYILTITFMFYGKTIQDRSSQLFDDSYVTARRPRPVAGPVPPFGPPAARLVGEAATAISIAQMETRSSVGAGMGIFIFDMSGTFCDQFRQQGDPR